MGSHEQQRKRKWDGQAGCSRAKQCPAWVCEMSVRPRQKQQKAGPDKALGEMMRRLERWWCQGLCRGARRGGGRRTCCTRGSVPAQEERRFIIGGGAGAAAVTEGREEN